jgi:hypothetical protein
MFDSSFFKVLNQTPRNIESILDLVSNITETSAMKLSMIEFKTEPEIVSVIKVKRVDNSKLLDLARASPPVAKPVVVRAEKPVSRPVTRQV